jgi:hypothetical protein
MYAAPLHQHWHMQLAIWPQLPACVLSCLALLLVEGYVIRYWHTS